MGCIYSNFEGECTLAEDDDIQGCENGYCVVEEDPIPENSCDHYESDWTCDVCGADLNADDAEENCSEEDCENF